MGTRSLTLASAVRLSLSLQGDDIAFKVNKLMSVKNLPYSFYSLPYCQPEKVVSSAENLGEVLRGDRILNSLYTSKFREDQYCTAVCRIPSLGKDDAKKFSSFISDQYRINM